MEEERGKSYAQITLYNQLIKEMDDLYRVYAKQSVGDGFLDSVLYPGAGRRGIYPAGDLRILVLHTPDGEFCTEKYDGGRSAYSACGGRQPQEQENLSYGEGEGDRG